MVALILFGFVIRYPLNLVPMLRKPTCLASLAAVACGLLLASCQKFSGSQTVPAYIHIDSISLDCDYYTYGANTC